MSEIEPHKLLPLMLPQLPALMRLPQRPNLRSREAPYHPRFSRGSPITIFSPVFNSSLDGVTAVSLRRASNSTSSRRHTTREDRELYGIRKYPIQRFRESWHPIENLMKFCLAWKVDQRLIQHLLMPVHFFLHVDHKSVYTVSEHAVMNMSDMLLGVKQWPNMLCRDEVWFILQQVLSGLEFLISLGLQHNMLNLQTILITKDGVVKIGAMHHIQPVTPEGWTEVSNALVQLARDLLRCTNGCGGGGSRCCYGLSTPGYVDSLEDKLNITRSRAKESTDLPASIGKAISEAKHMDCIAQAKGLRLRAMVEFASLKIYREVTPSLQFTDSSGSENSNLLKLSEENTSRKGKKSKHEPKRFARRRPNYGGNRRLLLSHRRPIFRRQKAICGGNQPLLLTQA